MDDSYDAGYNAALRTIYRWEINNQGTISDVLTAFIMIKETDFIMGWKKACEDVVKQRKKYDLAKI